MFGLSPWTLKTEKQLNTPSLGFEEMAAFAGIVVVAPMGLVPGDTSFGDKAFGMGTFGVVFVMFEVEQLLAVDVVEHLLFSP